MGRHTDSMKYAMKDDDSLKMINDLVDNDLSNPDASRAAAAIMTMKNVRMSW